MKKFLVFNFIMFLALNCIFAQNQTINGILTINTPGVNQLRIENDQPSQESVLRFRSRTPNNWSFFHADISARSTSNSADVGFIGFKVPFNNNPAEGYRMVINSSGFVGINTTNPQSLLDIFRATIGPPELMIRNSATALNRFRGPSIEFHSNIALAKIIGVDERPNNDATFRGGIIFKTRDHNQGDDGGFYERMRITGLGFVGIGTSNPSARLTVAGAIHSTEIKVMVNAGADFVFEDGYTLPDLSQVEEFIQVNKHLPEIASEKEMLEEGVQLGELNIKLLQKIEELTLYLIEQNKELKKQSERIDELESLLLEK